MLCTLVALALLVAAAHAGGQPGDLEVRGRRRLVRLVRRTPRLDTGGDSLEYSLDTCGCSLGAGIDSLGYSLDTGGDSLDTGGDSLRCGLGAGGDSLDT